MWLNYIIGAYIVVGIIVSVVVGVILGSHGGRQHYRDGFAEAVAMLACIGVTIASALLWPVTIVFCSWITWWRGRKDSQER